MRNPFRRKPNQATVTIHMDEPRKQMSIVIDGDLTPENLEKLQEAWRKSWEGLAELPEMLKEGQILRLREGDIVVFSHKHVLSELARVRIAESWKKLCEKAGIPHITLLVTEEGAKLSVLRREQLSRIIEANEQAH